MLLDQLGVQAHLIPVRKGIVRTGHGAGLCARRALRQGLDEIQPERFVSEGPVGLLLLQAAVSEELLLRLHREAIPALRHACQAPLQGLRDGAACLADHLVPLALHGAHLLEAHCKAALEAVSHLLCLGLHIHGVDLPSNQGVQARAQGLCRVHRGLTRHCS